MHPTVDGLVPSPSSASHAVLQRFQLGTSECQKLLSYIRERISLLDNSRAGFSKFASSPVITDMDKSESEDCCYTCPAFDPLRIEVLSISFMYPEYVDRLRDEVEQPLDEFLSGKIWAAAEQVVTMLQAKPRDIKSIFKRGIITGDAQRDEAKKLLLELSKKWQAEAPLMIERFGDFERARQELVKSILIKFEDIMAEMTQRQLEASHTYGLFFFHLPCTYLHKLMTIHATDDT
ncbi:hypothetical protein EV182_000413 [Spiromyces aspiralis]|uniref:Uncharacterized protein n=1 Tax=Spiromyces aspiralis TaxID=68401 RepID=A0ACC1HVB8_9FUNG|nr:hypothetical protein EV182_000413 [Spiromyces aspiralis]